jgi:hypothetical protein
MPPETPRRSKAALEAALARSLAQLAGAAPALGRVVRVATVPLSDYPQGAAFLPDEVLASVVRAVWEPRPLVAVLSFTPMDAMVLLRAWQRDSQLAPEEALEGFKRGAAALLDGALTELFQAPAPAAPALFREEGLVETLLSTHPKPDAMLFSAELAIATEEAAVPAVLNVLTDLKSLEILEDAA